MDSGKEPESSENYNTHVGGGDIVASCSNTSKVHQNSDSNPSVFTSVQQYNESRSTETLGIIDSRLSPEDSQGVCSAAVSHGDGKNVCGEGSASNKNKILNCVSNEGSLSKGDFPLHDNGPENSQRHRVCVDNSYCSVPSTSGGVRPCDNVLESSGFRESRKRPSSLKLNRNNLGEEDSSSDTGNDDYSLGSEDGCIYTYRGGEHLADLPSSFFSLDMGLPLDRRLPLPPHYVAQQQAASNSREQGSRASSPDMDFLEMDFDPGPSCDVDTEDESTPDADLELDPSHMPEENEPLPRESPEFVPIRTNPQPASLGASAVPVKEPEIFHSVPSTSRIPDLESSDRSEDRNNHSYGPYITHVNAKGEQLLVRRTMRHMSMTVQIGHHLSGGELVPPKELYNNHVENPPEIQPLVHQINQGERPAFDQPNLAAALYHLNMSKKLLGDQWDVEISDSASTSNCEGTASTSTSLNCPVEVPRCMVWSEREACERQVTQIGASACGATAIVNVFIALGVPVNLENINSAVGTRQRANDAPLPRYLLSRSVAGCTAAHLVSGINKSSGGLVTARFFPTYPERAVSLSHWLADWISLGAVPILTLNLQVGCDTIPDAWHHQMVFGVSPRGIYLCNPVECVRETTLWPRLTSPSVLLVRTTDVLSRFTPTTDLSPLMYVPDRRFHTFNVLGQVVNVLREWRATGWSGGRTSHIRVPAAYTGGVTLAALTGSDAHRRLLHAPQLPVLAAHHTHK